MLILTLKHYTQNYIQVNSKYCKRQYANYETVIIVYVLTQRNVKNTQYNKNNNPLDKLRIYKSHS